MNAQGFVAQSQMNPSLVLTGTAKEGSNAPPVGLVDIGTSEAAYLFRVALPGVRKDQCKLKCEIQRDGRVHIEGVISRAGVLEDSSTVYQMKVQELCPSGPFTISFNLPGTVDPRLSLPTFRPDGILEVIVFKQRTPATDDRFPPL